MPCNCGKNKNPEYVYTSPQGKTTVYSTQVQAEAAKIRNNGGTVTPR
jgi:hypothetical protein